MPTGNAIGRTLLFSCAGLVAGLLCAGVIDGAVLALCSAIAQRGAADKWMLIVLGLITLLDLCAVTACGFFMVRKEKALGIGAICGLLLGLGATLFAAVFLYVFSAIQMSN